MKPALITQLLESPFPFYMAGSKYFRYDSASSDTDLVVEYSTAVVEFIEQLGFMQLKDLRWRNVDVVGIYLLDHIHIQVVIDIHKRLDVMETIQKHLAPKEIKQLFSKGDLCNRLWDLCLELRDMH